MEKPFKKLNKKRQLFFLIGLCLSLAMVLSAFKFSQQQKVYLPIQIVEEDPIVVIDDEQISRPRPKPKKPQKTRSTPKKPVNLQRILILDTAFQELGFKEDSLHEFVPEDELYDEPGLGNFIISGSGEVDQRASMPNIGPWLQDNLKYSVDIAQRYGEPIIEVELLILSDGSIYSADIINSPNETLSAEVLACLRKMPKWQPAIINGKAVNQRLRQGIRLRVR